MQPRSYINSNDFKDDNKETIIINMHARMMIYKKQIFCKMISRMFDELT